MKKEYIFDINNPEEYPYGYEILTHKIRTGMEYREYLPKFPPEGNWIKVGPILDSNLIRIIRID